MLGLLCIPWPAFRKLPSLFVRGPRGIAWQGAPLPSGQGMMGGMVCEPPRLTLSLDSLLN